MEVIITNEMLTISRAILILNLETIRLVYISNPIPPSHMCACAPDVDEVTDVCRNFDPLNPSLSHLLFQVVLPQGKRERYTR
jgi:hypothetical protein